MKFKFSVSVDGVERIKEFEWDGKDYSQLCELLYDVIVGLLFTLQRYYALSFLGYEAPVKCSYKKTGCRREIVKTEYIKIFESEFPYKTIDNIISETGGPANI